MQRIRLFYSQTESFCSIARTMKIKFTGSTTKRFPQLPRKELP